MNRLNNSSKDGNQTVYEDSPAQASGQGTSDTFKLSNQSQEQHTNNISGFNFGINEYFDEALWTLEKDHNWKEEAVKILSEPAYVVTLILCVLALIANTVSIMAVKHIRSPLTMHLKLIINLAASDISIVFGVSIHILNTIFNQPFALYIINPQDRLTSGCILATVSSINVTTFLISLFNLITISVDHYIAIMLPFSYQRIMSPKHGVILITVLWVAAAIGGFSNFLFGLFSFKEKGNMFNYCEYIMYDSYHAEYLVFSLTLLCLTGITFIYIRIYCEVLRLKAQCCVPDNTFHNRKALTTTLLIIGTFCACWLPYCIFQITMIIQLYQDDTIVQDSFNKFLLISKYLYILQVTNSLLDPIIYAVRLNAVKSGYLNFINRLKYWLCRTQYCWKKKTPDSIMRKSSNATTKHSNLLADEVNLCTMKSESNDSCDFNHLHNSQNGPSKDLNDSDINENELVVLVTINPDELYRRLDSMGETEV